MMIDTLETGKPHLLLQHNIIFNKCLRIGHKKTLKSYLQGL